MKEAENLNNAETQALNIPVFIGSYGYYQKGNRYHWRINGEIKTEMGFKSKDDCDKWIEEKRNQYGFEWRVGFMVKFKSEQTQWYLVDKNGIEIKAF
jgi:hypothetical protein